RAALFRGGIRRGDAARRLRREPRGSLVAEAPRRGEAAGAGERPRAASHVTGLVLRGGTVIDGTGAPERRADVAMRGDMIVAVERDVAANGATVLDVAGRVVAPGFIDIHSHSDEAMFVNDALESALHMGVTLVVCGNCGGSSAPVSGLAEAELDRELARLDVKRTWSSFGEYAAAVDRARPSINVCSFVGHGTLRSCVMGADARAPTANELARMRTLLAKSMDEGAIGLASGLIYPPSAFGTTDELAALCAIVRERGGLYASHIRNESTRLLDAVEENLEIGRRSGVRVELSHHKASGKQNWGKVKESTALIERARAEGVDVTADQYPYTASSTGLAVTIPNWVHEGGTAKMCDRLRDPAVRERIRGEDVETGRAWDRIVIARARHHPEWAGKDVQQLATEAGRDPLERACGSPRGRIWSGSIPLVCGTGGRMTTRIASRSGSPTCSFVALWPSGPERPRASAVDGSCAWVLIWEEHESGTGGRGPGGRGP